MSSRKTRIISIASGKGGVGKSSLSVNLAWQLASTGHKVCLIDADLGLANVDIILNISPEHTLENVIFDNLPLEKAILPVHPNLDVISGGSGVARLASLNKAQRQRLFREFQALDQYDYILMDNSPGIAPQVLSFCLSSRELVVVLNPEATSLTDGYALIKVLKENGLQYSPLLILNKSRGSEDSKKIYEKMNATCKKYLQTQVTYLGDVPRDEYYEFPPRNGGALVELFPLSGASRSIKKIAERLVNRQKPELYTMEPEDFWEKSMVQYQQRKDDPGVKQAEAQLMPPGNGTAEEILEQIDFLLNELGTLSEHGKFDAQKLSRKMNIAGQKLNLLSYKNGITEVPAAPFTSLQQETNSRAVGLACPDLTMKSVLKEIIEAAGFKTIDVFDENMKTDDINMTLFCLEKPDEKVSAVSEKLNGKPAILIAGYQQDLLPSAFSPNVKLVIKKPFPITSIQSAIEDVVARFHA